MHSPLEPIAQVDEKLRLRTRLTRLLIAFAILQAIFALGVLVKSKYVARKREATRPATYPSVAFAPITLERDLNSMRLYMRGHELMEDIVAAIDGARTEILVETFIWVDDASGRIVRDALSRAGVRGVNVYVLWDWLLSDHGIDPGWFGEHVEAYPFKQITPGVDALRPGNLLRDHRKLIVVDHEVGFIGGYNFGEPYIHWRDTHLRVEGAAVLELANAFGDFWNQHVPHGATRMANVPGRAWDPHVLVHRNDPSLGIFPIRGMYLEAIDRAADRIWITNAYFVPDRAFRDSLTEAARRGVDVRVLLPEHSNHPMTDALAHGMFEDLLAAGVRVFLYRNFMLHAKTAVIDETWVTVGTANLDRWSMLGNYEVNVEVHDAGLAAQLGELYEVDMQNSNEVHLEAWRRRPLHWKVTERMLRNLAPLM